MGQQQLLLLVLATILVGIAVVAGIAMFQDSALNANIDTVTQDNVTIASKASEWFNKSVALGGGGGDFNANGTVTLDKLGYTLTGGAYVNDNGTYTLTIEAADSLTITGITTEQDDQGNTITIETGLGMNADGSSIVTSQVQ